MSISTKEWRKSYRTDRDVCLVESRTLSKQRFYSSLFPYNPQSLHRIREVAKQACRFVKSIPSLYKKQTEVAGVGFGANIAFAFTAEMKKKLMPGWLSTRRRVNKLLGMQE